MHTLTTNKYLLFGFLLILLPLLYLPSLNGGFYHDDRPNLVYNPTVQISELNIKNLHDAATSSGSSSLKRPISMISFALNYYFFGPEPLSFRVTNLGLHIFISVLIFFIFLRLSSLARVPQVYDHRSRYWFAATIMLIWAIHPLHVSTVAYIVQRMAMLSTVFSLLAILCYIAARTKLIENNKPSVSLFIASLLLIFLGVFSKENAILTPFFILLIELIIFYPLTNSESYKNSIKKLFLGSIVTLFITLLVFLPDINNYLLNWYYSARDFSLDERVLTQSRVILYYIKWFFIPNIQELGLYHDDIPLSSSLFQPITTLISIIILSCLLLTAVKIRKTLPFTSLGIGWFFIGHILESTIIPLEMTYEHRNYFPAIGLTIVTVDVARITSNKLSKLKKYQPHLIVIVLLILSLTTVTRATQWSDPISYAYFEAQHHPDSARANHLLGLEYRALTKLGELQYKEPAYYYLTKASKLNSRYIHSEVALLKMANENAESATPELIDSIAKKLSHNILKEDTLLLLRDILSCNNNSCLLPNDAGILLINAAESNPRLNLNNKIYSSILSIKANFILERYEDKSNAEIALVKAIELSPNIIQNYIDYVHLLLLLNRPDEAVHYVELALASNKDTINTDLSNQLKSIVSSYQQN